MEAGVRELEELRQSKAAQASAYEQEIETSRQRFDLHLAGLEQHLASKDTELQEARELSEQTLLQLHQMQQEREHYVQSDSEKQRQLEAGVRELEELWQSKAAQASAYEQEMESLRQRLEPQVAELEHRLATRDTELQEARQSSEQTLLQLHQIQQERELYFQSDSEKQRQLEAGVRELEELRQSKAALQSAHVEEMEFLRQRLEPQVVELEQHLATRDIELREMRKEAELSLLQLHQVQEELEHYFLADAEKKRRLEVVDQDLEELRQSKAALESSHELELEALRQRSLLAESEKGAELKERVQELEQLHRTKAAQDNTHAQGLEALRKRLEPQIEELEQRLASRDTELRESREEAELSLLQLHQVQEELEHYFLKARASDQLAQAQLEQLQRAQALMVRMHPGVLPTDSYPPALAVEVLPEVSIALTDPSLQTKALLSTYAASLQRASALLERARRT